MATTTTVFGYTKPAEGDLDWDTTLNNNLDLLDADLALQHNSDGSHGNTLKLRAQVVADATARAAIAAPVEGLIVFQSDTDAFWIYDGAAWELIGGSGGAVAALLTDGSRAGSTAQAQDFSATGIKANVVAESSAAAGVTADGVLLKDGGATLTEPLIAQEETAAAANPGAGYRKLYPRDFGGWAERDDGGYEHAVAWAGGNVAALIDEPTPAMWQHKNAATGSSYGALRIECGRDTLAAGTCAITLQKAFTTILEVFLQDKTAANAMYPSSPATSGFTANGTGTDTFAWLAIGVD